LPLANIAEIEQGPGFGLAITGKFRRAEGALMDGDGLGVVPAGGQVAVQDVGQVDRACGPAIAGRANGGLNDACDEYNVKSAEVSMPYSQGWDLWISKTS
jgi:hypothetical protein